MVIAILFAVLFFGLIILLHELGHFLAARYFGVTVHEFSIGMGPKILSKKSRSGITTYTLRAIPCGGYVSMAGEDDASDDPNAFCNKSKHARFVILAAGAFMNLLLGFLLMLCCVIGSESLYSNTVDRFLLSDTDGQAVVEYQGLCVGDELLAINDTPLRVRYDYVFAAMRAADTPVKLTVRRDGAVLTVENFVFPTYIENGQRFGNPNLFVPSEKEKSIYTVLHDTFFQTTACIKTVIVTLYDLAIGRYGTEAVSGPIGVVSEVSQTARQGALAVLYLLSMITINIGVFNLLPFPALDGGRIVLLLIEQICRRPLNKKFENALNLLGLMLLFGMMILITLQDISRLIP